MKKVVFLAVSALMVASLAFAQAGSIGIFGDPAGTNCNLLDNSGPGLKQYYVVHVNTPGATASEYQAKMPTCMVGATYLSDTNLFPVTLGNSQTGVSVGYGTCRTAPINTQIISVFVSGLSTPCCRWYVTPNPNTVSGKIEGVDCAFESTYPTGGTGIVNPNSTCQCNVPTEETTWGQVKALYTE
jgi:hypothetical protein